MTQAHAERVPAESPPAGLLPPLDAAATEALFEGMADGLFDGCAAPAGRPPFLEEILGTLRWLERTPSGVLHVRTLGDRAKFYLFEGQIRGASGAGTAGIGERMLTRGLVSEEGLAEALRMQRRFDPAAPLGLCLALVSQPAADALQALLREQLVEVIRHCSAWPVGVIQYEAGPVWHREIEFSFRVDEIERDVG